MHHPAGIFVHIDGTGRTGPGKPRHCKDQSKQQAGRQPRLP
jgi:hypothetical protein